MVAPANDLHEVRFSPAGPGERLEVALTFAPQCGRFGALLFSPQPFLGGDMDNNVILALARAFAAAARPVFRFNYRSVGRSDPVESALSRYDYWNGVMARKKHAAIDADADEAFARARRLFRPALLAGYSFGAHVALRFARTRAAAMPLVLAAPPLGQLDFADINRVEGPVLLVFPGDDDFDPPPPPEEIARRFPAARSVRLAGADHFFRGREEELGRAVLQRLGWSCKAGPVEQVACCRS